MNRSNAARLSWRRVSRPLAGLMLLWVTGCGGGASLTAPVVAEPPNCKTTVASGFSGDLNALFPNAGGDSTGGDGGSGDGGSGDGGGGDGSGSAGVGGGEGKVLGGLVSVTRLTASVSRCSGRIAERAITKPIAVEAPTPIRPKTASDQASVPMMLCVASRGRPSTRA